jgi:hypothetical protein
MIPTPYASAAHSSGWRGGLVVFVVIAESAWREDTCAD